MNDEKKCPQCGEGKVFYKMHVFVREPDIMYCLSCGYETNTLCAEDHELEFLRPSIGFGIKYYSHFDKRDTDKRFTAKTDYAKEVEEFDKMVSDGRINPINSYLTKAEGNNVEFLRGSFEQAKKRLVSVNKRMKTYAISWLETNEVEATVRARSLEEAIKKIDNRDWDDIETLVDGEPHPDSFKYALLEE